MARGRMLNQTVATDKKLNELSMEAELLYLKTIPHLDRDGLILGEPMLLWAKVCPRRPELMNKTGGLISEWIKSGLVNAYKDSGDTVLFFVGFAKNQVGMRYNREPASTFAPPPGYRRTKEGMVQHGNNAPLPAQQPDDIDPEDEPDCNENDGEPLPEECRKNAGRTPEECPPKVIEENRKEGEYNAGAQDVTQNAEPLPPTSVGANGFDSMMNAARERANGNYGKRREQVQIDGIQKKLKDAGVSAEQFTVLVDEHLTQKGTKSLADGVGALADTELRNAQQFVIELISTGKRFHKTGGVKLLWDSWKANDKRPNPSELQLMQHAHQMVNGKIRKNGSVPNSVAKPSGTVLSKAENLR